MQSLNGTIAWELASAKATVDAILDISREAMLEAENDSQDSSSEDEFTVVAVVEHNGKQLCSPSRQPGMFAYSRIRTRPSK